MMMMRCYAIRGQFALAKNVHACSSNVTPSSSYGVDRLVSTWSNSMRSGNICDTNMMSNSGNNNSLRLYTPKVSNNPELRIGSLATFSTSVATKEEEEEEEIIMMENQANNEQQESEFDMISSTIPSDFEWNPKEMLQNLETSSKWAHGNQWNPDFCSSSVSSYLHHLHYYIRHYNNNDDGSSTTQGGVDCSIVNSPITARYAMKTVLKAKIPTQTLRTTIRSMERTIGLIRPSVPMTDDLSFQLLQANGKAGNIGRSLALLNYRKLKQYKVRGKRREFKYAIQSILSAGVDSRMHRSPYAWDTEQKAIDNPTRWLDAILMNMHERGVQLDTGLANWMLMTYASTGRSGRATHFFYKLETSNDDGNKSSRMKMRHPPQQHKIPSLSNQANNPNDPVSKLAKESSRDWSLPLTSAFAFADSLTHGACGHEPIELDVFSWNTLIKVCCYRGALWRAIHLLKVKMKEEGVEPNVYSYNTILHGLARVGDRTYLHEFLIEMTNQNIPLNKYSIQALILGLLNVGDVGAAITLTQDIFNQHKVLPPYTSHLDILEYALVNNFVYEAKRHVYFLQQLWKWDREEDVDWRGDDVDEEAVLAVELQKLNPKIGKEALIRLFEYHGEELKDEDFF